MPKLNGYNQRTKFFLQTGRFFLVNLSSTYQKLNYGSISTSNVMEDYIQPHNTTITWTDITIIQDDDASVEPYTMKISKNDVEQVLDGNSVELTFTSPTVNTAIRVPLNKTFNSKLDDVINIELKSNEAVITEEVALWLSGYYN